MECSGEGSGSGAGAEGKCMLPKVQVNCQTERMTVCLTQDDKFSLLYPRGQGHIVTAI